jgi:MFS family permease
MKISQIDSNLRANLVYNLLDGAFFGLAIGFASFITIVPLFVSTLTDSAVLIGMAPAMHSVGWYLPQLLIANRISRLPRFKPMVMIMTVHERLPFIGLALVAWFLPQINPQAALVIVFALLIWQGLGGGLAANPWQNMIGKVFPDRLHGTFFGAQSGLANVFGAGGALVTGYILERFAAPQNFAGIFMLAAISLALSMLALGFVREKPEVLQPEAKDNFAFRQEITQILRTDAPFRKFLLVRSLIQVGVMAFTFYTVFITKNFAAPGTAIGIMTAILSVTKIIGNVVLGQVGDRVGHRFVLQIGGIALTLSTLVAWMAPSFGWFYLAFALAGIAYVSAWTTPMAMTLQFGRREQRPAYVGLSNTVTAPSALLAPLLGGLLADAAGYQATFFVAAICGVFVLVVLRSMAGWQPQEAQAASVS